MRLRARVPLATSGSTITAWILTEEHALHEHSTRLDVLERVRGHRFLAPLYSLVCYFPYILVFYFPRGCELGLAQRRVVIWVDDALSHKLAEAPDIGVALGVSWRVHSRVVRDAQCVGHFGSSIGRTGLLARAPVLCVPAAHPLVVALVGNDPFRAHCYRCLGPSGSIRAVAVAHLGTPASPCLS